MRKPARKRRQRGARHLSARHLFDKQYPPPGTPPGSLLPDELLPPEAPKLHVIDYEADRFDEVESATIERCRASLKDPSITWIHVHGRANADTLRALGEMFELHPLALEDVLNRGQRPKFELYGNDFFVILGVPRITGDEVCVDQVSLFLGKSYVVSFFDGEIDPFEPVRKRLRSPVSQRFKAHGADYLFYALADIVIDHCFPVLEQLGEQIDQVEIELGDDTDRAMLHRIHRLKRDVVMLRRFLWPQRDVLAAILRDDQGYFTENTKVYLRDCYDHAVQVVDLLENYREMCASLLEVYLSSVSHRLNEAMRVLTVISTIFIPLSFLVGVYGMNFEYMPELHSRLGYPAVWLIIVVTAVSMLIFFRRRGWI